MDTQSTTHPYEPSVWSRLKVGTDYLVSDGRNKYSVPYDLIGETVDVRLTRNIVEVYYRGDRVAAHVRLTATQWEPVVKPEHMPEAHRKYIQYNAEEFTAWAVGVGNSTAGVVRCFLTSGREAEQGYKACASLTKLAERYFSSLPLMLLGSQMLAKEIRHGMITLVADGVLSTSKTCA